MSQKNRQNQNKSLDVVGRTIVGLSGLGDEEVRAVAAKPFLFSRIQAGIKSQAERESRIWSSLVLVSRRAIPVMSAAALVSLGVFLYVNGNKSSGQNFSVDAYLGAGNSGIDSLVIAEKRLTDDDVLRTIVRDEREAGK